MNNMILYDTNKLENYLVSYSGTNLDSSTIGYCYDNRSDNGYLNWNSLAGNIVFGFSATMSISEFMILNHNFLSGSVDILVGGTWTSVFGFGFADNAVVNSGTFQSQYFRVNFSYTIDGNVGQCGEIVLTNKKFQLNYNPSGYNHGITNQYIENQLWTGLVNRTEISQLFNAVLAYELLQGDDSGMVDTDLQNLTELARNKQSFLFYPNGNSTDYPMAYGWRKRDIYKCKIMNDYNFTTPLPYMTIITASYELREVK